MGEGVLAAMSSVSWEFFRSGSGEIKAGDIEAEAEAGEELLPAGDSLASPTLLTFFVSLSSSGSLIGS